MLFRTAMSPGIREQGDCFPMIANKEGKMVVGQFGSFIGPFLEAYDEEIEEGDIILTNDPYMCNAAVSHLPDWVVLVPIFKDGRHIAWSAMFGHMSDNGGMVPGSIPIQATTIFQEGIRIPPTKLYKKGVLQADLLELILHNVRTPQWNRFDLNALVAACNTAAKRCVELAVIRFGDDVLFSTMDIMLQRNYEAMKHIIGMFIPEEPREFEDYICDDGMGMGPYKIKCTMWREGEKAIFDFAGTDPQAQSSVNFFLERRYVQKCSSALSPLTWWIRKLYLTTASMIWWMCVFLRARLLKPNYPAALSGRTHALGSVSFDVLGALLGMGAPEMMLNAAGFSDSPHLFFSGYDSRPKARAMSGSSCSRLVLAGFPVDPVGDGPDGHSLWPGFTNVPNEFIESYFPLRIERYETIPDSGGAGLHRGGNGLSVCLPLSL